MYTESVCVGRGGGGVHHVSGNQGTHSKCIFKFPVFSLSDRKFSMCQIT